jgi:hypothetical protein
MHPIISRIKQPALRLLVLLLYYAAILAAVIYFQTHGNFSTPPFVYQGF